MEEVLKRVEINLPGPPQGKGRPRFTRVGRAYTPGATRAYELALATEAKIAMIGQRLFEGPLRVEVVATMPIPASWSKAKRQAAAYGALRPTSKPDADNALKVLDALNGIVFRDDAQIVDARVIKVYGDESSLNIVVEEIGNV